MICIMFALAFVSDDSFRFFLLFFFFSVLVVSVMACRLLSSLSRMHSTTRRTHSLVSTRIKRSSHQKHSP